MNMNNEDNNMNENKSRSICLNNNIIIILPIYVHIFEIVWPNSLLPICAILARIDS